jgi:hypothetical protein
MEWFKSQKNFYEQFSDHWSCLCADCPSRKASETRILLRSPSNTEYGTKAFGALQESFDRAGQASLRLRLVPPFVPLRDGSQTHYHCYYLLFVSFLLLTYIL